MQTRQQPNLSKIVIEDHIDSAIQDLKIAREQLIRHSEELPKELRCDRVFNKITGALVVLGEIYN